MRYDAEHACANPSNPHDDEKSAARARAGLYCEWLVTPVDWRPGRESVRLSRCVPAFGRLRLAAVARLVGGLVLAWFMPGTGRAGEVLVLRSGNGAIGGPDSTVHYITGAAGIPLRPVAFTPADFAAA